MDLRPEGRPDMGYGDALVNRGVATWLDAKRGAQAGGACRRRIYAASLDARLIALYGPRGVLALTLAIKGQYHSAMCRVTCLPDIT